MISQQQLEQLLDFQSERFFVTSFYLNLDPAHRSRSEVEAELKEMVRKKQTWLSGAGVHRDEERSAREDLTRIETFVNDRDYNASTVALAVFSCAAGDLWEVFELPVPVRSQIVLDHDPYFRPLTVLQEQNRRFCVVLVDHRRAKILEWGYGKLVELQEMETDLELRVRAGGRKAKEQKRLMHQVDEHHRHHYKQVADRLFSLFRKHRFDDLIVGGHTNDLGEFESILHSYLQQRLVGRIHADPGTPIQEVTRLANEIEEEVKQRLERELVTTVVDRTRSGGLGVLGLAETLEALNRGQVHTLVVSDGSQVPGRKCYPCGLLTIVEQCCPCCEEPTTSVSDVIDEAIDEAMRQNCELHTVLSDTELTEAGGLGALLRFRV